MFGKTPSINDMFIMEFSGPIRDSENSLRRLVGILLGPQALEIFIHFIMARTSVSVQGFKNMLLSLDLPR